MATIKVKFRPSTIFGWSDPIALFKSRTKITSAGKTDTVRYFLNTHILMR